LVRKFEPKGFLFFLTVILFLCTSTGEFLSAQNNEESIDNFFKQPNLTLVYGTLKPDTTDFLKKQAYQIASGYRENENVLMAVKADNEINAADFKSLDIILLGKPDSNKWFQLILPKLPIKFEKSGYVFGGKLYTQKNLIIRLLYPNPLNPGKLLAIYTGNNENELFSRYFEFHLFGRGGEYAITQENRILRSGYFKKKHKQWTFDINLDKSNEGNLEKYFNSVKLSQTRHYDLYFYPDSPLAPYIETIGKIKEDSYSRHFWLLKVPLKDYKIRIYYFKNVQQMIDVGMFGNDPATLIVTFIGASFSDIVAWGVHEDMHPLSYQILGQISGGGDISSPLLGEGIACLVQGLWHGKPLDYWAAKFLSEKKLPNLDYFFSGYRILNWLITYPASGHFVKFLLDAYGEEKFRRLWNSNDIRMDIPIILGVSEEKLESQWHDLILSSGEQYRDKLKVARDFELGLCYYWDEDFPAAEAKFRDAFRTDPNNPEILYFFGRTCLNLGKLDESQDYFRSYLKAEKPAEYEWMTPHAFLHLGMLSDMRGERDVAIEYYRKVLSFPNERESHQYAEMGIAGSLQIKNIPKVYDLPDPWPFGIHIPAFRPELMGGPVSSFVNCLKLMKKGEYNKADKDFEKALLADKNDPDVIFFQGVNKYMLGKFKDALEIFNLILSSNRVPFREYIPTLINLYKGKIFDVLGDSEAARREYQKVLSLPDWRNAHQEAQHYLKEPYRNLNQKLK
jgi:tetratricopeptide (TPR) repeat protein